MNNNIPISVIQASMKPLFIKKSFLTLANVTAIVTSLSILGLGSIAQADTSWMQKIKPFKNGPHPKLKPTRLKYDLSWKGTVKAGEITFDFNKKDNRYKDLDISQAYGRSQYAAYAVFPYQFSMTSFAKSTTQKPLMFIADEKDKREKVKTSNTFKKNGVIHTSTKNKYIHNTTKKREHTFSYANSHDPMSAIQYIRRQTLKNGEKIYLCLHPFNSPMFSEVTVLGREKHNGRACIKLDVKLQKIDKKTMHLKSYDKLKKATLWISDDTNRIMVELRSEVFIGDVRAVLKSQSKL